MTTDEWRDGLLKRFDRLEKDYIALRADYADIREQVFSLKSEKDVARIESTNLDKRLSSIEDTLKWLSRLIVGALVLALVAFVVSGGISV